MKIKMILLGSAILVIVAFAVLININSEGKNMDDKQTSGTDFNGFTTSDNKTEEVIVNYAKGFYYKPISNDLKNKITGISYKENEFIDYTDLRYVHVLYNDFNGATQNGELIVNVQVAEDIMGIFKELYDNNYKIEKIKLIDEYNGDDELSMEDNNTSAFNFRKIDGQDTISDHSYGIAVDINPLYNPYVRNGFGDRDVLPINGSDYADRTKNFDYKIVKYDVCYNAFAARGWKWGGDWESPKDYQHFYKELNE